MYGRKKVKKTEVKYDDCYRCYEKQKKGPSQAPLISL